jgi:predicted permease
MTEIAIIALPFFGLILLGYGAGRSGRVGEEGAGGLKFFVGYLALPALFLQIVAKSPFSDLTNWSFVLSTSFSTYCAFAIAFSLGALVNHGNIPGATIEGLAGSFGNIGLMAPGLTLAAFGSAAAAPTALVFSFDSAMLVALTPLMMTLGGTDRADGRAMARTIGREIFLNPLILATLAGFALSATGLALPGPVDALFSFLASAAVPGALFVVGLNLAGRPLDRVTFDLPFLILIKLLVHPLIVYLLLSWIGGFNPVWVESAVLMAALPPAADVLSIARTHRVSVSRASAAILYGTAASVATLIIALALIMGDRLPVDPFH